MNESSGRRVEVYITQGWVDAADPGTGYKDLRETPVLRNYEHLPHACCLVDLYYSQLPISPLAPRAEGLWCFQCGALSEGMSTVNPCFGINPEDYQECPASHNICKRYSNEGVLVLACSEQCVESHTQTTDITCCTTDGCNFGVRATPSAFLLVLAALMALLSSLFTAAVTTTTIAAAAH
ncbi:uncharacterized protein [Panulirus ornatus]|uniref:uncharacterized protein n=1 Tax=Panulirus ornatus TaxID=150431 RepID=UPI003A8AAA6C